MKREYGVIKARFSLFHAAQILTRKTVVICVLVCYIEIEKQDKEIRFIMKYILIAGIDGVGKTSLIGVLKGFEFISDDVYDDRNENSTKISYCLENNLTFTQETTLAGHRIEKTIRQARQQGSDVVVFYVGLNSAEESVLRIANRVRKGGHDIPEEYVRLRYQNRMESLKRVLPLCDEVVFYDNENGFVKVAEIKNNTFNYTNGYRPDWIQEVEQIV